MAASLLDTASVNEGTTVPDLLRRFPHVRAILDKYGLRGCGGANGPNETLGFFARMHGIATGRLIDEIRQASTREAATPSASATWVDSIYRRYFLGGIAVILTVGAGWGVWLLWQIGFSSSFTGVSIHQVNAHGHAQIFGWVGLFIMGFGYQAFPRFWQTSLPAPRLAMLAFFAMVLGIVVRTAAMSWHDAPWALNAAMTGAALEVTAISAFAWQVIDTWRRSEATLEPYVAFIFGALAFFIAQAVLDTWHTYNTMAAGTREELLWYVATYQAVLRDLQVHGLALFMILGVSLRMLPAMMGLPAITRRRGWTAFALLVAAVIGESLLFIAYRWTGNHALAAILMVPWLMLAVGSLLIPWAWRLWRPAAESGDQPADDRSFKFVRAAYCWLAVSMVMLLMLPVYQVVSGIPFSHAYYGSIRHAITVGFISLMIMGVAAKVVPMLNGVDGRSLSALWGPFVLVNVGCLLRVSLQTLTDWHPLFFAIVGVSGLLELTGLTWWGIHLARVMVRGERSDDAAAITRSRPERILESHHVADVLHWMPEAESVLLRHGFTLIRNQLLRRTVARQITLGQAAKMRGVSLSPLLAELNAFYRAANGPTVSNVELRVSAHAAQ